MKNTFFLLFTILLFLGCKESDNNEDFFSGIKNIKGEIVNTDALIGRPAGLCCTDTRLFILDRYENRFLTIIDTKNNKSLGRELTIGGGPGEVSAAPVFVTLSNNGKQLDVYQRNTFKYCTYDFTDDKLSHIETINIERSPANIVAIENGFVGIGMMYENGRYGIYNNQGDLIQETGVYPNYDKSMDHHSRFFIDQGHLCSHPNGTHFALGTIYSDNVEFFSSKNGEIKLLKRYGKGIVNGKMENNLLIIDKSNITGYKGTYTSEKYCYMLYSGKPYGDNPNQSLWSENIFVFDWNGNFVKSYRLDNEVRHFCVDEINNVIYGVVTQESEYAIMKFIMS